MKPLGFQPAKPAPTVATQAQPETIDAGLVAIVADARKHFPERGVSEPTREELHAITIAFMSAMKAARIAAFETAIELRTRSSS